MYQIAKIWFPYNFPGRYKSEGSKSAKDTVSWLAQDISSWVDNRAQSEQNVLFTGFVYTNAGYSKLE